MLLGSLAVATAAGVIPLSGVAGAQSQNASPCARGGPYPPAQQGQTTDRSTYAQGQNGNVRGCASPRSRFGTDLNSHPRFLGSGVTDDSGVYSLNFTIPADAEIGIHKIVTTGTGVVDGVSTINVVGSQANAVGDQGTRARAAGAGGTRAAGGGRGALPRTGSASTAPLTAAGIGLVLIGSAAVVVTRRRRSEAASATH